MVFSGFPSIDSMSALDTFCINLKRLITEDSIKTAFTNIEQVEKSDKINLTELIIFLCAEEAQKSDPPNRKMVEYAVAALVCVIAPIFRKGIVSQDLIIFRNNDTKYNDSIIATQQYPAIPLFVSKKDFIKWQQKEKSIEISETLKQLLTDEETESSTELGNTYWANERKKDLKGMARVLALHFWRNDDQTRITDMAKKIYGELEKYAHTPDLPELEKTINTWIKDVAPEFASRRGRPKKK